MRADRQHLDLILFSHALSITPLTAMDRVRISGRLAVQKYSGQGITKDLVDVLDRNEA